MRVATLTISTPLLLLVPLLWVLRCLWLHSKSRDENSPWFRSFLTISHLRSEFIFFLYILLKKKHSVVGWKFAFKCLQMSRNAPKVVHFLKKKKKLIILVIVIPLFFSISVLISVKAVEFKKNVFLQFLNFYFLFGCKEWEHFKLFFKCYLILDRFLRFLIYFCNSRW